MIKMSGTLPGTLLEMKEIVKKVKQFDDSIICTALFNKLTKNGTIQNYSANSNGIFFELNKINSSLLSEINSDLDRYKAAQQNVNMSNAAREAIIDSYKKELKTIDYASAKKVSDLLVNTEYSTTLVESDNESESELSDSNLFGSESDCESE